MKHLQVRHQYPVADPLQQERVRRALRIIVEHQEEDHASRTLRQSLNPQSTARRDHCQPAAVSHPLHSPTGMAPVTGARVYR
jgi:hypothetical protein